MALTHAALLKTTLLDFPGEVASVIFTPQCNLRCPYCHNPELVLNPGNNGDLIPISEIRDFLKKRSPLIGGVVITGGEPLMNSDLPELIEYIKALNLKVKIDTNGLFPQFLSELDVDYIAMDMKTSPENYHRLGLKNGSDRIMQSIEYILSSSISHEFRTTVIEDIVREDDIRAIAPLLREAERWYLTPFKPGETLDRTYSRKNPPSSAYMEKLVDIALSAGAKAEIR